MIVNEYVCFYAPWLERCLCIYIYVFQRGGINSRNGENIAESITVIQQKSVWLHKLQNR